MSANVTYVSAFCSCVPTRGAAAGEKTDISGSCEERMSRVSSRLWSASGVNSEDDRSYRSVVVAGVLLQSDTCFPAVSAVLELQPIHRPTLLCVDIASPYRSVVWSQGMNCHIGNLIPSDSRAIRTAYIQMQRDFITTFIT